MKYTAKTMIDKENSDKLLVRVDFQHRKPESAPGIPSFALEVGGRKGYYRSEGAYDLVTPELTALCISQHTSAIYNVLENLGK